MATVPTPDSLRARVAATPLYDSLGVSLETVGSGTARAGVDVGTRHCNLDGVLQGGVSALVADLAMGCAARTGQSDDSANKTLELGVDFHAPVRLGQRLTVDARVVARAGRLTWVEAVLRVSSDGDVHEVGRARSLNAEARPG